MCEGGVGRTRKIGSLEVVRCSGNSRTTKWKRPGNINEEPALDEPSTYPHESCDDPAVVDILEDFLGRLPLSLRLINFREILRGLTDSLA